MTSKVLQNIVLSKYQKDDTPAEIHRDLYDEISLATNKGRRQVIRRSDSYSATGYTCWSTDSQSTAENI